MVLKRAVILKIYYMPNGLTSLLHKKIYRIFRDVGGKIKKGSEKNFVKNFKERPSKMGKRYFQDLVKQTVD